MYRFFNKIKRKHMIDNFENDKGYKLLSESVMRKFIDTIDTNEYEVLTDSGWSDISSIGKTVKYKVFKLKTENHELLCADTHIVFNSYYEEVYVKDLIKDDVILTENARELVVSVEELNYEEHMFDLQLNDENHRFYTNGILSHNSLWLCNLAAELIKAGYNVMYYTLEMSEKKVLQRIGSNLLNIPIKEYFVQTQDKVMLKKKLAGIEMQNMRAPGKLFIKEFPTGQASTLDLEAHCNKVEESTGLDFPIIISDYLGIMKNWRNPNTENMYLKGKHISEDLRGWGVRKNKVQISAIQTNKGSVNASDFSSVAVAESSGLNHTVDGMFAIIQDEIMYANMEYFLKTLLNRNDGFKNTKKRFDVNYNYMRITEDINSEIIQGL